MNTLLDTKKQPTEEYARERLKESPLARLFEDLKAKDKLKCP